MGAARFDLAEVIARQGRRLAFGWDLNDDDEQ